MDNCFKPGNVRYARKLILDEKNLCKRWYRAKDYLSSDGNEHWQKALRDVKTLLRIDKFYPWI